MNKISQFWQELKRRNVVRVVTVYAGAAFVILELVDIIAEPLKLPSWFLPVAIVLLSIGLIIAIILSWIYDINPEGGMVKTEPADKSKTEDIPKSSISWKIASFISFIVIIGLIILQIISPGSRSTENANLEKSIAVLPFRNDSSDEENTYFINGVMESILDNLCKVEDLRVPGRTSVEQYRNAPKPVKEIAQEMNVSYILGGSGQKIGSRILLTVQLLDGRTDEHLWSKQYDREISRVEDLIDIQGEIARLVAGEIRAIITPEEEELIHILPTQSMNAYEFYQRGMEAYHNGTMDNAKDLFFYALEYDSTFAHAYGGLALVYKEMEYWQDYFSENFLDSSLLYANIALSFDHRIPEAYAIRGEYYEETGDPDLALLEYDHALKYNPNYIDVLIRKGNMLAWTLDDPKLGLITLEEAHSRIRGKELPGFLHQLGWYYGHFGFPEIARNYHERALKIDGDSVHYFSRMGNLAVISGNYIEATEWFSLGNEMGSSTTFWNGYIYSVLGEHEEAYRIHRQIADRMNKSDGIALQNTLRIGYAFWMAGEKEEAAYYFNEQIRYCEESIRLERDYGLLLAYYDLAAVQAFLGQREEALQNLEVFSEGKVTSLYFLNMMKHDPLFNGIREEERFQTCVKQVEDNYLAKHDQIRQWLEENDML